MSSTSATSGSGSDSGSTVAAAVAGTASRPRGTRNIAATSSTSATMRIRNRAPIRGGLLHNEYDARPMDRRTLDSELADGASHAAWLATLSRFFAAPELVFGHGTDNARGR